MGIPIDRFLYRIYACYSNAVTDFRDVSRLLLIPPYSIAHENAIWRAYLRGLTRISAYLERRPVLPPSPLRTLVR